MHIKYKLKKTTSRVNIRPVRTGLWPVIQSLVIVEWFQSPDVDVHLHGSVQTLRLLHTWTGHVFTVIAGNLEILKKLDCTAVLRDVTS